MADLKQELEKRGLETKGLKLDLANRLIASLATEDRVMAEDGKDRLQPTPHVLRSPADKEQSPSLLLALLVHSGCSTDTHALDRRV